MLGTKVTESIKSWYRLDHAEKLDGSDDFGFISGTKAVLDGYSVDNLRSFSLTGGTKGKSNVISMTIPTNINPSNLDGRAFKVIYPGGEQIFVFDNGHNYQYGKNVHTLDVSGSSLTETIKNKVQPVISKYIKAEYVSTAAGRGIAFTTVKDGLETNDTDLYNVVINFELNEPGYHHANKLNNILSGPVA